LAGLVLTLGAVGMISAGAFATIAASGETYVDLGAHGNYRTDRYGLATNSTNWRTEWLGWGGSVRLKVASAGQTPIFVGVAAPDAISRFGADDAAGVLAHRGVARAHRRRPMCRKVRWWRRRRPCLRWGHHDPHPGAP
jgi:hypothetical protein